MTMKRILSGILCGCVPVLLAAWAVGTVVRDGDYFWIWLYFIPAPFVVAAALVWLVAFRRRARWLRVMVAVLALWPAGKILFEDVRWNGAVEVPAGALKVVHWNVARLPFGLGGVERMLAEEAPDICLISEPGDTGAVARAGAAAGLTNQFYSAVMTLLSRFPVSEPVPFQIAGARGWRCRVATRGGPLDLCGVDLVSKPTMRRGPPIAAVAAWLDNREPGVPLLVLGDFNTPRDARAFAPFRARFAHAFEAAGCGWPYSWPLPFPAYQLDHAWFTGESLRVCDYALRSSRFSDHRRQVLFVLPVSGR